MIDVLKRLEELDAKNPNIDNPLAAGTKIKSPVAEEIAQLPDLTDLNELKALSGVKPVNECGMMDMGSSHQTPASFSINASAATGDEVAGMLTQIMNLAGVHKVGSDHMPDKDNLSVLTAEPGIKGTPSSDTAADAMRATLDKLNEPGDDDQPEDEGALGAGTGAIIGNMVAGPAGGVAGAAMGGALEDEAGHDSGGPVAAMADEVRDMADELSGTSKEELGLESYSNTPNDPTAVPAFDSNKFAHQPNSGNSGDRMDGNMPKAHATFEDQLYAEYKKFVSEGKDEFGHGKNFAKIAKSAGGGEKGNRIAGKIRADKIKKAGGKVKYAK